MKINHLRKISISSSKFDHIQLLIMHLVGEKENTEVQMSVVQL